MSLHVLKPGAATTVQDGGRDGRRHLGVGRSGALDAYSARVANRLLGNDDAAAVLEMTLSGAWLRVARATRIAITGARIDVSVEGQALPGWRPIDVPAGAELRFGACRAGARAYLAVSGGLDVPCILGSRATDLRGGFGGLDGRALRAGDELAFAASHAEVAALHIARWWVDPRPDLDLDAPARVSVMPGRDALAAPDDLFAATWRVAAASDRQGLRLEGPALALVEPGERVSAPVAPGTVQLPPDGRPIVLLGEAQTVGGYPVIGHVAQADLPRLAQCRPGETLQFAPTDRDSALARLRAQAQRLERMRIAISRARSG